jgi:hypothetical protein
VDCLRRNKTNENRIIILNILSNGLKDAELKASWNWLELSELLCQLLEECVDEEADSQASEILNLVLVCLTKIPITKEIIRKTRVIFTNYKLIFYKLGKFINHYSKNCEVKRVQMKASALLCSWKRYIQDEPSLFANYNASQMKHGFDRDNDDLLYGNTYKKLIRIN